MANVILPVKLLETVGEPMLAIRCPIPKRYLVLFGITFAIGVLFFFSNPTDRGAYDYTFRMAEALLHGRLGLDYTPPTWLNEMIPLDGRYYSSFPLGSVITMIPVALLKVFGLVRIFPGKAIAALIASALFLVSYGLTGFGRLNFPKRLFLAAFPVLATWTWTNLAFGGSWQLVLGFGMLGELGVLYFTLVKSRPVIAGLFFALAFGNRTELLLTAPAFLYFMFLKRDAKPINLKPYLKFLAVPLVLLALTLWYNFARFGSPFQFGYTLIPGVLQEPWYAYGIFSLEAIPRNFHAMFLQGWRFIDRPPFFLPDGFGGSIFLACPFLFLLFRGIAREDQENSERKKLMVVFWTTVIVLTFALFVHGNPGGWQFAYRYAIVLVPWFLLVLILNSPPKIQVGETLLFTLSIFVNVYATYLFYWTQLVR
jgi:hypothetical protein